MSHIIMMAIMTSTYPESRDNDLEEALRLWERRVAIAVRRVADVSPATKAWVCSNPENRLRLMNWKVWALRHHVSAEFILSALYKAWRSGPKFHPDGSVSLGLSISSATGKRAEEIVQDEVRRTYPARENELLAREEIRCRCMDLRPVNGADYVKSILSKRAKAKTAKQYLRAWRGNPWK